MPSLNAKRRASDLLRQAYKARLEREAAPVTLHLFQNAPPSVEAAPQTPVEAPEVVPPPPAPPEPQDKATQRYRWRCLLCQMFARQYRPDTERARAAKDYAYANRRMIHEAFDRGVIKAVVLNALRVGFELQSGS